MEYKEQAIIIREARTPDGAGGFITMREEVAPIKVKTAPYKIANGELVTIPNPIASVKFFTNSALPVDDEELFFLRYKGKVYKKVALTDYGKCTLIVGEKIEF